MLLKSSHPVFELLVLLSKDLVFILGLFLFLSSRVSAPLGSRVVLLPPKPILLVLDDTSI